MSPASSRPSLELAALLAGVGLLSFGCAPRYVPESLDLSGVRIGEGRQSIERALRVRYREARGEGRVVVVYDYGPGGSGARRAAEAGLVCLPSIGGAVWCSIQRSIRRELVEESVAELQGSILQVVYDAEESAEWVVFGSTWDELARANALIDTAERGEGDAALQVGRHLAEGAGGFPIDSVHAYRWLSIAVIRGVDEAVPERDRIAGRLGSQVRSRIDRELQNASPPAPP